MQAISKIGMQSVTQKTEIWCKVCKVDMAHKRVINSDAKHTEYVIIKNIHTARTFIPLVLNGH